MTQPWDPSVAIDEDSALNWARTLFPDQPWPSLRKLGAGWDNTLFITPNNRIIRFAHRELAAKLARAEYTTLQWLDSKNFKYSPRPIAFCDSSSAFPFPVMVIDYASGTENAAERFTETQALELNHSLKILHSLRVPTHARQDELSRTNHSVRAPQMLERLTRLKTYLDEDISEIIEHGIIHTKWSQEGTDLVVVHGDLHFRHVLFAGEKLDRLIDWGDSHLNRKGNDYIFYWSELSHQQRSELRGEFHHLSEEDRSIAFFLSLLVNLALLEYGLKTDQENLSKKAHSCILNTVEGYDR